MNPKTIRRIEGWPILIALAIGLSITSVKAQFVLYESATLVFLQPLFRYQVPTDCLLEARLRVLNSWPIPLV